MTRLENTAFLFPGQGAQSVGMLDELSTQYPEIKETVKQGSNVLGYDLWSLISEDDSGKLNQTQYTQPALLVAAIAIWRTWQSVFPSIPGFVAGHSLGEYAALVVSGVLSFDDAVSTVALRGELMQNCVKDGDGLMAAVLGLTDEQVIEACASITGLGVVEAANFNAPGQVVISGNKNAVLAALEACKLNGAKRAIPLDVSVPSHCALMNGAAEDLASHIDGITFNEAVIPVVANVNASPITKTQDIKEALIAQLFSPVKWTASINRLVNLGVTQFVQCGPGNVLVNLNKRIAKSSIALSLSSNKGIDSARDALI